MKAEDLKIKQIVKLEKKYAIAGNGLHYISSELHLNMFKNHAEYLTLVCDENNSDIYISQLLNFTTVKTGE